MRYVDGYVLPVPKKNIQAYRRIARMAARIFREHGALEYRECVGDELRPKWGVPFPRAVKVKPGETVVFSWIVFKSRAHRNRVNAKVMKDPRMANMDMKSMPFDPRRMLYGGFKILVQHARADRELADRESHQHRHGARCPEVHPARAASAARSEVAWKSA